VRVSPSWTVVATMPKTRKRPAQPDRPSRNHTNTPQSNGHRRQDGYASPTAEDRREAAVLAEAAEMGYRLAVSCLDCGHYLVNPISVAHHRGPTCRARKRADR
jgi:hypothetical protein